MPHASPRPDASSPSTSNHQANPSANPTSPIRSRLWRSASVPRTDLSRTSRATSDDARNRGRCCSFSGGNPASILVPVPEIDWASDRLARACGQLPTDFERYNPHTVPEVVAKEAPRYPVQDPRRICGLLDRVLCGEGSESSVHDYFEAEDLIEAEAEDSSEPYEEQIVRGLTPKALPDGTIHVFGTALQDIACHAMASVEFAGYMHELPTVVYSCVEELYRTGMYQDALFRTLPDSERLASLVSQFDLPSPYSLPPRLRHENTATTCSLLTTYLHALPSPLMARHFYDALWAWCVEPSTKAAASHTTPDTGKSWIDVLDEEMSADEKRQIAVAQYVLRLLPPTDLSLLIYLLGFFAQLPVCRDNGLTLEDIGRIFARRLLGGPHAQGSATLMVWLLCRWGKISKALLEDDPECAFNAVGTQVNVASMIRKTERGVLSDAISTGSPDRMNVNNPCERVEPPYYTQIRPILRNGKCDHSLSMSSVSSDSSWTSGSDILAKRLSRRDIKKPLTDLYAVHESDDEVYEQSFSNTIHFQCDTSSVKSSNETTSCGTSNIDTDTDTDTDTVNTPGEEHDVHFSLIEPGGVRSSGLTELLILSSLARHRTSVLEDVCDALEETITVRQTAEARSTVSVYGSGHTTDTPGGHEEKNITSQTARQRAAEQRNVNSRNWLADVLSEMDEARAVMINLRRVFDTVR